MNKPITACIVFALGAGATLPAGDETGTSGAESTIARPSTAPVGIALLQPRKMK